MKKILFSLMTLVLVIGLVGAGAFAYFSDTETSTGNTLTAGTLDLEDIGSFTWGDVAPGDVNTETISLNNSGSIDALSVYMELDVTDSEPTADTEPEDVAEAIGGDVWDISTQIEITSITYDGVDVSSLYADANANGWLDLDDLDAAGEVELTTVGGVTALLAGETDDMVIEMTLRTDTENEYQGDRSTVDELARITQD